MAEVKVVGVIEEDSLSPYIKCLDGGSLNICLETRPGTMGTFELFAKTDGDASKKELTDNIIKTLKENNLT